MAPHVQGVVVRERLWAWGHGGTVVMKVLWSSLDCSHCCEEEAWWAGGRGA